jgi:hypothetical protein
VTSGFVLGRQFIDRRNGETFRLVGVLPVLAAVVGRPLAGSPLPPIAMQVPFDQIALAAVGPHAWQGEAGARWRQRRRITP